MLRLRKLRFAAAILAFIAVPVPAQEQEQEPLTDDAIETEQAPEIEEIPEVIEEIIVVSPRPGSRRRVDEDYEDPVKAQLLKDFYRMKELEEEYEWRASASKDDSSRIKWGYDPREEYRMRNDMALRDLSFDKQKPATVFRVDF